MCLLFSADIHQLLESKDKVLHVQWNPSLDQENLELPHIKKEQEELWADQEDADISPVPVRSEDDKGSGGNSMACLFHVFCEEQGRIE